MKRIVSIILAVVVITAVFTGTAGAVVSYDDLNSSFTRSSNKSFYNNSSVDDNLQLRANSYGYALRIHYGMETFPVYEGEQLTAYGQIPGEFTDKSSSGKTYDELEWYYSSLNPNSISTLTCFGWVTSDCEELGYTTTLLVSNPASTYVPPAATNNADRRLVALVTDNEKGFLFYMQHNDKDSDGNSRWSYKEGDGEAKTYCDDARHTEPVDLNDSNISQHLNCHDYDSEAIYFYVDALGSIDRFHLNGMALDYQGDYFTKTDLANSDIAGSTGRNAQILQNLNSASYAGHIAHKGDVDYYFFDVAITGTYDIEMIWVNPSSMTLSCGSVAATETLVPYYEETSSSPKNVTITMHLTKNVRYFVKIIASGQTQYEADQYYYLTISQQE